MPALNLIVDRRQRRKKAVRIPPTATKTWKSLSLSFVARRLCFSFHLSVDVHVQLLSLIIYANRREEKTFCTRTLKNYLDRNKNLFNGRGVLKREVGEGIEVSVDSWRLSDEMKIGFKEFLKRFPKFHLEIIVEADGKWQKSLFYKRFTVSFRKYEVILYFQLWEISQRSDE